jgi:hypothetical protein
MQTISLRKFRDSIPELGQPTEVVRREPDGTLRTLGTWTPAVVGHDPSAAVLESVVGNPNPLRKIAEAEVRFNSQPFTGPIPKVRK